MADSPARCSSSSFNSTSIGPAVAAIAASSAANLAERSNAFRSVASIPHPRLFPEPLTSNLTRYSLVPVVATPKS